MSSRRRRQPWTRKPFPLLAACGHCTCNLNLKGFQPALCHRWWRKSRVGLDRNETVGFRAEGFIYLMSLGLDQVNLVSLDLQGVNEQIQSCKFTSYVEKIFWNPKWKPSGRQDDISFFPLNIKESSLNIPATRYVTHPVIHEFAHDSSLAFFFFFFLICVAWRACSFVRSRFNPLTPSSLLLLTFCSCMG